ncbi:MAG: sialate O-acetylesterase [Magnetococcales bacterium]|nr:hypothetical protein [Magnetococcales bacterium]NGZ28752.1 sialate O-acetylesterase [Magnetococcales bacterium]
MFRSLAGYLLTKRGAISVFLVGAMCGTLGTFLYMNNKSIKQYYWEALKNLGMIEIGYHDTSSYHPLPCDKIPNHNRMVALTFGQSNSANSGSIGLSGGEGVYNFYNGQCYVAKDTMLGATGKDGSVWSRLGRKLIQGNLFDSVIFIAIGVGNSSITDWGEGGNLAPHLRKSIELVSKSGLKITHIFFHQGETDNLRGTTREQYRIRLRSIVESIRGLGVMAPFYVARASRVCNSVSMNVIMAQNDVIQQGVNIFPGPNTDLLSHMDFRIDCAHFSQAGLELHAEKWLEAIQSQIRGGSIPLQKQTDSQLPMLNGSDSCCP